LLAVGIAFVGAVLTLDKYLVFIGFFGKIWGNIKGKGRITPIVRANGIIVDIYSAESVHGTEMKNDAMILSGMLQGEGAGIGKDGLAGDAPHHAGCLGFGRKGNGDAQLFNASAFFAGDQKLPDAVKTNEAFSFHLRAGIYVPGDRTEIVLVACSEILIAHDLAPKKQRCTKCMYIALHKYTYTPKKHKNAQKKMTTRARQGYYSTKE